MSGSVSLDALLRDLNGPQREAVTHRDGPLLVLAGPGSGKTRVITRRAAHLVHSGVRPQNLLAITFTNKAADEMRQRIAALGVARGMWVYTFHALGVRLLREFGPLARVEPGFSIYDEADQKRLVKEAMALCQVSDQMLKPDQAQGQISHAKNRLETPAQYAERAEFFDQRLIARIYEAYEGLLEQRNAVDFDDLLMRVALVLRDQPEIAERLNIRFQYLLIDEYQDTNRAQYLIARSLSQHHQNICATGDPDQSIYGWRGADIGNILQFEHDYPNPRIVRLEQNYRSTKVILRVASQLIKANRKRKHKDLWTENGEGEPATVWEFGEGRDEAQRIAAEIAALHGAGQAYGGIAIAYRVNALSRGLEEALRDGGIPYRIARGVEFYNRKEIRDAVAYLRVLVNPRDDAALLRIINTPTRGIGATTVKRLVAFATEQQLPLSAALDRVEQIPSIKSAAKKVRRFVELLQSIQGAAAQRTVADAVREAIERAGLDAFYRDEGVEAGEDRIANLEELISAAARYAEDADEPTLAEFLQRVSLTSDQDAIDGAQDAVLLLTLHAAKGLEFPVVFIVGLEEGLLPHERALMGDGDLEEERRLCFVGVTRAQERLYLTHARQRFLRGQLVPRPPSQFLRELPDDATVTAQFNLPGWMRESGASGGYVPLEDQLPPDERPARQRRTERRGRGFADRDFDEAGEPMIDIRADVEAEAEAPFADWRAGTLVEHRDFGVGTVAWIRPGPGQTRASVKFAGQGEKVFILEFAPLTKLR
jgi:DNA helicase II / ATP-dependent DNA helicase PcrA